MRSTPTRKRKNHADTTDLSQQRFLILLDQDYEDLEYWYPKLRLLEAARRSPRPARAMG